jgi:hypothetical protein
VIGRLALGAAVVTRNDGPRVAVLDRHRLRQDRHIIIPELILHVHAALAAERAFIRRLHVLVEAVLVYAVAALHEDDGLRRVEHVVAADGAVAVRRPLDALVRARHGYTRHAFLQAR